MIQVILGLLFARVLKKKRFKIKKAQRVVKQESSYWILLAKDLLKLVRIIFKFVIKTLSPVPKKQIRQATVAPKNIVDFEEYKLKKAK